MRRILLALAFLAPLWALPAYAVDCQYRATSPTLPDQQFIILQCDSAGKLLTTQTPSSATSAGVTPSASTAAESSHVFKSSPGNLYAYQVTTGAAAGFVMIFNATSAPADGAVTPAKCVTVAANSTVGVSMNPPEAFSTGITGAFSTTGCFVKTASATATFSWDVK